jgi:hypothetical protein
MWWSVFISSIFHWIKDFADDAVVSLDCVFTVPKLGVSLPKYWIEVLAKVALAGGNGGTARLRLWHCLVEGVALPCERGGTAR